MNGLKSHESAVSKFRKFSLFQKNHFFKLLNIFPHSFVHIIYQLYKYKTIICISFDNICSGVLIILNCILLHALVTFLYNLVF